MFLFYFLKHYIGQKRFDVKINAIQLHKYDWKNIFLESRILSLIHNKFLAYLIIFKFKKTEFWFNNNTNATNTYTV